MKEVFWMQFNDTRSGNYPNQYVGMYHNKPTEKTMYKCFDNINIRDLKKLGVVIKRGQCKKYKLVEVKE